MPAIALFEYEWPEINGLFLPLLLDFCIRVVIMTQSAESGLLGNFHSKEFQRIEGPHTTDRKYLLS